MSSKTWQALACAAVLVVGGGGIAAQQQSQQHQHEADKTKQGAGMAAKCQAMMADHQKMMTDMKAADDRLNGLVAKMDAAAGQQKIDATAVVVKEMVAQRATMRDRMMNMHQAMMSHMMEHMQAGPGGMAMCPMMQMMQKKE